MAPADSALAPVGQPVPRLVEQFEHGLDAPICLTWELTYACNLACVIACPRRASATRAS